MFSLSKIGVFCQPKFWKLSLSCLPCFCASVTLHVPWLPVKTHSDDPHGKRLSCPDRALAWIYLRQRE